jgi:hypothetical protein
MTGRKEFVQLGYENGRGENNQVLAGISKISVYILGRSGRFTLVGK